MEWLYIENGLKPVPMDKGVSIGIFWNVYDRILFQNFIQLS